MAEKEPLVKDEPTRNELKALSKTAKDCVTHEVNNPLAIAQLAIEAVMRYPEQKDDNLNRLQSAMRQIQRCQQNLREMFGLPSQADIRVAVETAKKERETK